MKVFNFWLTALIVINVYQIGEAYRILAIFPYYLHSHFYMYEELMESLAKKGHQVDVYSHFPRSSPLSNYKDFSLSGTQPNLLSNVQYRDDFGKVHVGRLPLEFRSACELLGLPVFQKVINHPPTKQPYDIVIVEIFAVDCFFAFGRLLNIPMIGIMTMPLFDWMHDSSGMPREPSYVPSMFYGHHLTDSFWGRLSNYVLGIKASVTFNYYASNHSIYVNKYFGVNYPSTYELRKDFALVLVNSHFSLHGVRSTIPSVVEVAGLHIKNDTTEISPDIKKWMDESTNGFIYVSFGTMTVIETFPSEFLEAMENTFRNISPIRVLIKIGNNTHYHTHFLDKNVKREVWIPQLQVLAHKNVKAFISHGGLMGSIEAIINKVPMIAIPLFGDQMSNAKQLVRKGIAVSMYCQDITQQKLTAAIYDVINNPSYKNNIEKLSREFQDRPKSPLDTAIFWIEYVGRNGNILRSPTLSMPFWKRTLLDVYGALMLFAFLALYVPYLILAKLFRFYCNKKQSKIKKN